MNYSAAIETGMTGLWYGRIIELIGTHARGNSFHELMARLQQELDFQIWWLESHTSLTQSQNDGALQPAEIIEGVSELGDSGGEVALFIFDLESVSNSELDIIIRNMGYNRQDLLDLIRTVPESTLLDIPEGKKRNILDILHHICNAEEFYLSRFGPKTDWLYEKHLSIPHSDVDKLPIIERLDEVRTASILTLREIVPACGNTIFTRTEYTQFPQERWTARKVLRRFLEHEREHIYNIRMYLGLPARWHPLIDIV
ncbi:MAG: hypothetical protein BAJATHORv1_10654 [Candidatus Thorarchaeota archaeon]|nr:MAG: hypothetical protein BAJATHORv1_10654 [Candidatus Thorarchaeota archaeon]